MTQDTETKLCFMREDLYLASLHSMSFQTANGIDLNDFDCGAVLDLLSTAEYFLGSTDTDIEVGSWQEDEIGEVLKEVLDFFFKVTLKPLVNWTINEKTTSLYAATTPFKNMVFYIFYGCGTETTSTYFKKNLMSLSPYDFSDFEILYNILGPNLKEIFRPIYTDNKLRLYS